MRRLLDDFARGLVEGRYCTDELPTLDFGDDTFDLALCSHFLFTHSEQLSTGFYVAAIEEMSMVVREARGFPLLNYDVEHSLLLRVVVEELRAQGYQAEPRPAPYTFQRRGDWLLSAFVLSHD